MSFVLAGTTRTIQLWPCLVPTFWHCSHTKNLRTHLNRCQEMSANINACRQFQYHLPTKTSCYRCHMCDKLCQDRFSILGLPYDGTQSTQWNQHLPEFCGASPSVASIFFGSGTGRRCSNQSQQIAVNWGRRRCERVRLGRRRHRPVFPSTLHKNILRLLLRIIKGWVCSWIHSYLWCFVLGVLWKQLLIVAIICPDLQRDISTGPRCAVRANCTEPRAAWLQLGFRTRFQRLW